MAIGRPSLYTAEIAEEICEGVARGVAIETMCETEFFPSARSVYTWLRKQPDFAQEYAHARARYADKVADEIIDIADKDPDPQRARNRIDARKWVAGKRSPLVYGDKQHLAVSGELSFRDQPDDELRSKLALILANAGSGGDPRGATAPEEQAED